MATLKGTWRFNDVLTVPSEDILQDINFTTRAVIAELGVDCFAQCSGLSVLPGNGYILEVVYCVISATQDLSHLGFSFPAYLQAYKEFVNENDGIVWSLPQIITITDEQEVSDEFYEWFTANATQQGDVTITYKGEKLAVLDGGEYVTLHTNGKTMEDDIRVEVAERNPVPTEVATEAEMTALLETAEIGSVYKYTGESGTYESGALYVVEESE